MLKRRQNYTLLFFLHSNAQRPGAVTGMMVGEVNEGLGKRKFGDSDRAIILVKNHKTG